MNSYEFDHIHREQAKRDRRELLKGCLSAVIIMGLFVLLIGTSVGGSIYG